MINALIQELEQEITSTGELLNRVPEEKLEWKPHPKSMTLGQLALHVAEIPGLIAGNALDGTVTAAEIVNHPQPTNKSEIIEGFSRSIADAKNYLSNVTESDLSEPWTITDEDKVLLEIPKASLCRIFMFNHWFHHRGQLTVYLRLLDVKLPSVYGPSADENPFG